MRQVAETVLHAATYLQLVSSGTRVARKNASCNTSYYTGGPWSGFWPKQWGLLFAEQWTMQFEKYWSILVRQPQRLLRHCSFGWKWNSKQPNRLNCHERKSDSPCKSGMAIIPKKLSSFTPIVMFNINSFFPAWFIGLQFSVSSNSFIDLFHLNIKLNNLSFKNSSHFKNCLNRSKAKKVNFERYGVSCHSWEASSLKFLPCSFDFLSYTFKAKWEHFRNEYDQASSFGKKWKTCQVKFWEWLKRLAPTILLVLCQRNLMF